MLVSTYEIVDYAEPVTGVPELWKDLKTRYTNVYFAENGFRIHFYGLEYFSDPVHLNNNGAKRFTCDIAQEFRDVFQR
jgi:hypothetical protein